MPEWPYHVKATIDEAGNMVINIDKKEKKMTKEHLPKVAYKESLNLMGHVLEVLILDNGQRVYEKESLERFFKDTGFMPE